MQLLEDRNRLESIEADIMSALKTARILENDPHSELSHDFRSRLVKSLRDVLDML